MTITKRKQSGFGIVEVLIVVVVIVLLAGAGWLVYQNRTRLTVTGQSNGNQTAKSHPDPYAGWKTFTDNASGSTSGISIRYPSEWQVNVAGTKTYAWSITQAAHEQNSIVANYIFADSSKTARQEWADCELTDACGATADDKSLTGSETTINGLSAYTATMQNSAGTFHVTVIRGDKPATPAGTPFVILKTYATDQSVLNTYTAITASATFPN